jgi:4-fold beta flower protein
MSNWIFDRHGRASIILDEDCFRDRHGKVIAWTSGNNIYSLRGKHCGWYEDGVLYDSGNRILGFLRGATGHLPSIPGIGGTPGTPGFTGRPGRPGFGGTPGRPGRGGWSDNSLESYFSP